MSKKSSTSTPKKGTAPRYNRAQRRAIQERAQDTAVGVSATSDVAMDETSTTSVIGKSKAAVAKFRPKPLSRDQEYAFIRSDLRRLAITAGSLFGVMMVLLVVLD